MDRVTRPRKRLVHRRRRRRRQDVIIPGPRIFVALAALCVGVLWTVMVLFFSMNMEHANIGNPSSALEQQQQQTLLRQKNSPEDAPFPHLQLWPDDLLHKDFLQSLTHCSGEDCTKNTSSQQSTKSLLIILLRPHGHFGQIMEELLETLVQELKSENVESELFLKSFWQIPDVSTIQQLHDEHDEIKLIHCISSPLLLEAVDLALTVSEHDHNYLMNSWKDIEAISRMLVHWHSSVNPIADRMPSLLVTLQAALTLPQRTDERVANFLVGEHFKRDEASLTASMMKIRDKLSQRALDRIDRCTRAIQSLVPSSLRQNSALHSFMKEMTASEISRNNEAALAKDIYGVIRQVHMLLNQSDEQVCMAFPQFCLHQKVMLP